MSGGVEGVALLPCPNPWCASHTDGTLPNEDDVWEYPALSPTYRVQCSFCPAEGPVAETEAEAITAWNTRTTPPARTYAEGVEDAAKICDERAAGRARMYEDNQAGINAFKAVEAEEAAAAIRLLSQGEKALFCEMPDDQVVGTARCDIKRGQDVTAAMLRDLATSRSQHEGAE